MSNFLACSSLTREVVVVVNIVFDHFFFTREKNFVHIHFRDPLE